MENLRLSEARVTRVRVEKSRLGGRGVVQWEIRRKIGVNSLFAQGKHLQPLM